MSYTATRPTHRSFVVPSDEIYRENPAKFPETKWFSSGPNTGCQRRISFHWTKEALIYNISHPSSHPSHPCKLFGTLKNIISPAIIAALILTAKLMICKENPAKISVWEKNPPK
jgi:hypothetical protein